MAASASDWFDFVARMYLWKKEENYHNKTALNDDEEKKRGKIYIFLFLDEMNQYRREEKKRTRILLNT